MAAGELVDDETVLALVTKAIDGSEQLQKDGFVLDGYPRTLSQADQLQTLLASRGLGLNSAVCLDVSDEVLIDRICSTLQRYIHAILTSSFLILITEPETSLANREKRKNVKLFLKFWLNLLNFG